VKFVFLWLFEGSNLQLHGRPGAGNSHSVEAAQDEQAACRNISVGTQGLWQLLYLEGAPDSSAVPNVAMHSCCMVPEGRVISQEDASAGALTCFG